MKWQLEQESTACSLYNIHLRFLRLTLVDSKRIEQYSMQTAPKTKQSCPYLHKKPWDLISKSAVIKKHIL